MQGSMDTDDVELEFISVMGVLVPMELTKGISSEVKHFTTGDISNGEENTNYVDVSNDVEHTEIKCTNRSEEVKTTKCSITTDVDNTKSRSEEQQELKREGPKVKNKKRIQVHESIGPKKKVTAKVNADRLTVSEDKKLDQSSELYSLETNGTAKVVADDGSPVHVEHWRKAKKSRATRERFSTSESNVRIEDTPIVATVQQHEKREKGPSISCLAKSRSRPTKVKTKAESELPSVKIKLQKNATKTGKAKKKSTDEQTPAMRQKEAKPLAVQQKQYNTKRSTTLKKAKKSSMLAANAHVSQCGKIQAPTFVAKANSTTTKVSIDSGTSGVEIDGYSSKGVKSKTRTATEDSSEASVGTQPLDTTTAKAKDKRSRPADMEAETSSSSTKQLKTTRIRITQTWKLDSGDEDQDCNNLQKSTQSTSEEQDSSSANARTQDSSQPAPLKSKHNGRPRCSLPDCTKFAHARRKCIAHGGGSRCVKEGCDRRSRSQGKCYAHGGGVLCSHPNCTTRAKSKGKCVAHGGGTLCSEEECNKLVTANGKCISHGGWVNCSHPGCQKRVQLRGKCMEHSEVSFTDEGDKLTKRFRKATNKPSEMHVPRKKHKSVGVDESAAVNKPTAGELDKAKMTTEELDEATMALRSGQRIKLVTRNGYTLQSEEDALQMALKLSEIEF